MAARAQSEVLEGIFREVYTRQAMWTSAEVVEVVRDEHISNDVLSTLPCYESRARSRLRSNGPCQCIRRARFATRLLHSSQFTMGGYAPHTPEIVVIRFHLWWVRREVLGDDIRLLWLQSRAIRLRYIVECARIFACATWTNASNPGRKSQLP